MKSLQKSSGLAWAEAFLTNQPTARFFIEGLLSVKVSQDLPPEEIYIQSPILEYSINDEVDNTDREAGEDQFIKTVENQMGRAQGYINNTEYYLEKGGAFEEGLPRHHKYRSVQESELFQFIAKAIEREEEVSKKILSQASSIADLTEISNTLNVLVDKAIMAKREGDLNQAFKYYDAFFQHNQTWFMLWYGVAKLLCLFREYRMAFACIKICTYIYPKMWEGRQYTSDHNLSYHYEQMYALAIKEEENESYLKTLGRPLNTVRILNASGKPDKTAPVFRVKTINPQDLDKLQRLNLNNISKLEEISNLDSEAPNKSLVKSNSNSLDITLNLSKRSKRRNRRKK